jgi:predicted nuclease of restriction endonuclease-like RecB superfamily
MLRVDQVPVRLSKGTIEVRELTPKRRETALELSAAFLQHLEAHHGRRKADLDAAWATVEVGARSLRLADGLRKLIDDRCTWAVPDGPDPLELRAAVFERSARVRRELDTGEQWDRDAVMAASAQEAGMTVEALEERLFIDLRENQRLVEWKPIDAEQLVHRYAMSARQSVLLRATRVQVAIEAVRPSAWRLLFGKLKFLRLLYRLHKTDVGYRIVLDGPYSLFGPTTKYGLQLAMLLPVLEEVGPFKLHAEVLWGPKRQRFQLELEGGAQASASGAAPLSDELQKLVDGLKKADGPWKVALARKVLELKGVGLCVPDLRLTHEETGKVVWFEALGYWSRDAVWKRVELVEQGLAEPIVFGVSSRLRVSEAALPAEAPASLYVYKGVMRPKALLEQVAALAAQ